MELYIGLMSGTSADGVDAALVRVGHDLSAVSLLNLVSVPFTDAERQGILALCQAGEATVEDICRWHFRLSHLYSNAVRKLLDTARVRAEDVRAVGLHGQTVQHLPGEGTLQLGNAAVLANAVNIAVVHDFRSADMALGGQGAPLVPFFDQLVFGREPITSAVQNLGGIGNVTVVGPGAAAAPVIAFDTGPANMIIDGLVQHFTAGGKQYDEDGCMARSGTIAPNVVQELLQHEYFQEPPPKSTGRERFGRMFWESMLTKAQLRPEDWVATATAFTAASIAQQYQRFLLPFTEIQRIVVGGGGAKNPYLMELIEEYTAIDVVSSEALGVPVDAKEAMAFAVLAAANLRGIPAGVPEATGASRPALLGSVQQPSPR